MQIWTRENDELKKKNKSKWHQIHDRNERARHSNQHGLCGNRWPTCTRCARNVHKFKTQIQKSNHVLACLIPLQNYQNKQQAATVAATAATSSSHQWWQKKKTYTWAFMFVIIIIVYDISIWFSGLWSLLLRAHARSCVWVSECITFTLVLAAKRENESKKASSTSNKNEINGIIRLKIKGMTSRRVKQRMRCAVRNITNQMPKLSCRQIHKAYTYVCVCVCEYFVFFFFLPFRPNWHRKVLLNG